MDHDLRLTSHPRASRRRRLVALLAMLVPVALLLPTAPASAAPPAPAEVVLVHGVRGLLADITLDGKNVLQGFGYERATDPIKLAAGTHEVKVFTSGQRDKPPVLTTNLRVRAGERLTAAIGFDSNGKPHMYTFDDAMANAVTTAGTVVVRNVAASDAVTARLDDTAGTTAIKAGGQRVLHSSPGSHDLLVDAGSKALRQDQLRVSPGRVPVVYVVGQQAQSSLALVGLIWHPNTAPQAFSVASGGEPPMTWSLRGLAPAGLALTLLLTASAGMLARRRRLPQPAGHRS